MRQWQMNLDYRDIKFAYSEHDKNVQNIRTSHE